MCFEYLDLQFSCILSIYMWFLIIHIICSWRLILVVVVST